MKTQPERNIAWSELPGDEWYDPTKILHAFEMLRCGDPTAETKMLYAIGNGHAGTVYPASIHAIPIIISIALDSTATPAVEQAIGVLEAVFWFNAYPHTTTMFSRRKVPVAQTMRSMIAESSEKINQLKDKVPKEAQYNIDLMCESVEIYRQG